MKKIIIPIICAILALTSCSEQFNAQRALNGTMLAAQAMTLSDAEIQAYVHQYVTKLDASSHIVPSGHAYTKRLQKLTSGLTQVDGIPLNFKVYQTSDVNAFACADGSVRVYTGIMDLMTDDELLGVIGHEIGHVALKHTKKQLKAAMLRAAAMEGLSSTSELAATLTNSQLGAIGEAMMSARYSRKQETAADDYGYEFLKAAGKNPWAMAMSFEKLKSISESGGRQSSMVNNLFSSHPDVEARIERMAARATQEGYTRPKTTTKK